MPHHHEQPKHRRPDSRKELFARMRSSAQSSWARLQSPENSDLQERSVLAHRDRLITAVAQHSIVILTAPLGSGKSSDGPLCLLEEFGDSRTITVTQPRKLAAVRLARLAALRSETEVGDMVGYRTGDGSCIGPETTLCYATHGLELKRSVPDYYRTFWEEKILVIDELHELGAESLVLLGLGLKAIREGSPLKLLVMSGTLAADPLSRYLDNCPVISIGGQPNVIEDRKPSGTIQSEALQYAREGKNVLVFLSGKGEIEEFIGTMRKAKVEADLFALHADLLLEDQERVFEPSHRPKIVAATTIAQTSLSFEDFDVILDSGMIRVPYESESGAMSLAPMPASMVDTLQRRARIRNRSSIYINFYPHALRPEYPLSELERLSSEPWVFLLARAGLSMRDVPLFTPPSEVRLQKDEQNLRDIGVLDDSGLLTQRGIRAYDFPVDVRAATFLALLEESSIRYSLSADEHFDLMASGIKFAAVMSTGGFSSFDKSRTSQRLKELDSSSYYIAELKLFERLEHASPEVVREHGIFEQSLFRISERIRLTSENLNMIPPEHTYSDRWRELLHHACFQALGKRVFVGRAGAYHTSNHPERVLDSVSVLSGPQPPKFVCGSCFDALQKNGDIRREISKGFAMEFHEVYLNYPELFKSSPLGPPTYSVESDEVTVPISIDLHSQRLAKTRQKAPQAVANKVLATWITDQILFAVSDPGMVQAPEAVRAAIVRSAEIIKEGSRISGLLKKQLTPRYTRELVFTHVCESIGAATTLREIQHVGPAFLPEISESVKDALRARETHYIEFNGRSYSVDFSRPNQPTIVIPIEDLGSGAWRKLPDEGLSLSGQDKVSVVVDFGTYLGPPSRNLVKLKYQLKNEL